MGKPSNIEKYANESGIDPNKVGEVILTAMSGGEIPDLVSKYNHLDILDIKLDIQPNDSKEEVLKKFKSVLSALQEKEQTKGNEDLAQWANHTRDEVDKVLQWIEGAEGV